MEKANKRCFVSMPFGEKGSQYYEDTLKFYNDIIKKTVEGLGYSCDRVDTNKDNVGDIIENIITELYFSTIVIVDLTDLNPNVHHELGLRHAFKKLGTILIIDNEQTGKVPFNLSNYPYLTCTRKLSTINDKFKKELRATIKNLEKKFIAKEDVNDSPAFKYLGDEIDIEKYKEKIKKLNKEKIDLEDEKEKLKTKKDELNNENKELKAIRIKLVKEIQMKNHKITELDNEIIILKAGIKKHEEVSLKFTTENKKLEEEIKNSKNENKKLEKQIENSKNENYALNIEKAELGKQIEKLTIELDKPLLKLARFLDKYKYLLLIISLLAVIGLVVIFILKSNNEPTPDQIKEKILSKYNIIEIPAGEYYVGDKAKNKKAKLKKFYIDKYPITNEQFFSYYTKYEPALEINGKSGRVGVIPYEKGGWGKATGAYWIYPSGVSDSVENNSESYKEKPDHPVVSISFHDANEYAKKHGKRIPTREEWEAAARGPEGLSYPWGPIFDKKKANTQENMKNGTEPVTKYEKYASPFGCVDMFGNVQEWTSTQADSKNEKYYIMGVGWFQSGKDRKAYLSREWKKNMAITDLGFRCVFDSLEILPADSAIFHCR